MNVFDLFARIRLDTSAYDRGLKESELKAQGFGGKVGGAISTAKKAVKIGSALMSTAVVAFGAKSVKTGMEFDSAMSQVAATMGKTVDDMKKQVETVKLPSGEEFTGNLIDYAKKMGAETAFSASQAAEALNYMALAGYDAETSMKMLPNVLNLAAAGSMELAQASDMITDTQTAFGISLERTNQMVDEMAKAASTGNTSVEQLGTAFLTVGGLAQELNGGIVELKDGTTASVDGVQELEIALTAMANAGVKGSEAGTHMRNMLLKLSSPTSEGTKQLKALGVEVFDTEGKMRSLSDIFGDLNGSLSKLSQKEKIQAIADLFNTRDLASAEALLNAVGEDWDKIGESILDSEGAAQKMADTQLDNLAGDVTIMKSAFEGLQIAISDKLSPALRKVVQWMTKGMGDAKKAIENAKVSFDNIKDAVNDFKDKIKQAKEWMDKHKDAVIMIGVAFGTLTTAIVAFNIAQAISNAGGIAHIATLIAEIAHLGAYAIAQGIATAATTLATAATTAFGAVMAFVTSPITLVVVAIGALIAIVVLLIRHWDEVSAWTKKTWESIKSTVSGAISAISEKIKTWIDGMKNVGKNVVEGIWNGIKNAKDWIKTRISEWVGDVVSFIKGLFKIGSPSKVMAEEVGQWIPKGLGVGISKNADAVYSEIDAIKDELANPIQMGNVNLNASSITNTNNKKNYGNIISAIDTLAGKMENMRVVLSTGETVGALTPHFDRSLGASHDARARSVV